ncbi:MAG: PRC-barrel domain-containing protein [Clostridia bacterium]|nr:PRC-barrel domain-containing protein [Clostridia bacterium]
MFSDLKKKDVVELSTGKKLGRITDALFTFPEGKIKTVTVSCGFMGMGESKSFPFGDIEKIGEDAVLVRTGGNRPCTPCPPAPRDRNPCPPAPDDNCTPVHANGRTRGASDEDRLDFDDYE